MRKILLATSALVAFAGAAQAAESPIAVSVGGYVDFRAAMFHESDKAETSARRTGDFENVYEIDLAATGKAAGGIEYGAKIGLWNGELIQNVHSNSSGVASSTAATNAVAEHDAYVWLSGNFGKAVFGDAHSASTDLFVAAPTVGEGQIDGSYTDFVDSAQLIRLTPAYLDDDNNDTKVTYYTPKVGNADHKVQLGVSFSPEFGKKGSGISLVSGQYGYKNVTGSAVQYTGKFGPVAAVVSGNMNVASADDNMSQHFRDFTTVGAGAQVTYAGVTVGGSYVDAGHAATLKGQNKAQDVWTFGAKYGFDKVAVAANILDGRGYNNASSTATYVRDIQELGLGATYTWFPGLTTAADAVFFQQKAEGTLPHNDGHVLMLAQKLAF